MSDDFEAYVDKHLERIARDGPDTISSLRAENASLSAWQCVYTDGKTGLVGDEHGNQYCAMARRVEALRAEVERLTGRLRAEQELGEFYRGEIGRLRAENERLRAVLKKADEELAANGYRDTQWPRPDIRAALEEKQ